MSTQRKNVQGKHDFGLKIEKVLIKRMKADSKNKKIILIGQSKKSFYCVNIFNGVVSKFDSC